MSIPDPANETLARTISDAHTLVDLGVPVFAGRLTREGDPDARDMRWKSWQRTKPNHRPIDRYAPGEALGAVTGTVFDVIDIDPRNGGRFSFKKLSDELGDDGPEIYWEVQTSSGGRHLYIAPLGIGTHPAFMQGLDLKAEGGFVFIPGTIRPSKDPENLGQRVSYRALRELAAPVGNGNIESIRELITGKLAAKRGASSQRGRAPLSDLEQACLDATRGEQHAALLALVDEWARKTDDDDYIVFKVWSIAERMKCYDRSWPWTEKDVRGLLHRKERRPVPDATEDELKLLNTDDGPMTPHVIASGLQAFEDVEDALTRWWWLRYGPLGDTVIIDGDPGTAKSLMSDDLAARLTAGLPMPGESETLVPQGNVLLLAPEDRAEVIKARLKAHGADMSRVFRPAIQMKGKGRNARAVLDGHLLTFPTGIDKFRRWIESYNINLVIVDPISAFLDESVNSNNDASVRRALEPFAMVLQQQKQGCGAWMIRHLNKDGSKKAAYRGGGSIAFGAVARVHLFAGELPKEGNWPEGATHAVAQLKNSHLARTPDVALSYCIENSEIRADDDGNFVPRIRWCGMVDIEAEVLANGVPKRHGPAPTSQIEIERILNELFDQKDTWDAGKIRAELAEAGYRDHKTISKVRDRMGIRSIAVRKRGKIGVSSWMWTIAKEQIGDDD